MCCGLQPLSVDWREKLKANRKASSKGAPSRSSPDPASSSPAAASAQVDESVDISMAADGKTNLELLSKGLPAGWRAMWDKNSGDIYYGNLKTRVRVGGKGRSTSSSSTSLSRDDVSDALSCLCDRSTCVSLLCLCLKAGHGALCACTVGRELLS